MKRTQIPRCLRRKISLLRTQTPKRLRRKVSLLRTQTPKRLRQKVSLLEDVKPAGDSTSASKTPAESENPTESETPAEPETPKSAAKIGESEYASIADALAAAQPGDTIELLKDVTENITINKSLTLDLGKFTLSGNANAAVVTISGDKSQVIVQNGTVTGGKKVVSASPMQMLR